MLNGFKDIADALLITEEELNEKTLQAAASEELDRCLGWREWETFPLLSKEMGEHLSSCDHCLRIKAILENELESESFAHAASKQS